MRVSQNYGFPSAAMGPLLGEFNCLGSVKGVDGDIVEILLGGVTLNPKSRLGTPNWTRKCHP